MSDHVQFAVVDLLAYDEVERRITEAVDDQRFGENIDTFLTAYAFYVAADPQTGVKVPAIELANRWFQAYKSPLLKGKQVSSRKANPLFSKVIDAIVSDPLARKQAKAYFKVQLALASKHETAQATV